MVTDVTVSSQSCANPRVHMIPFHTKKFRHFRPRRPGRDCRGTKLSSCRHLDHHCAGYARPACRCDMTTHVHAPRSGVEARVVQPHRYLNGWDDSDAGLDSARAKSGARADWQACTTHAFLLNHRTSCTVFRAIVASALTTIARSFTTHLTSFVVHQFGPDSRESGSNPGTGLT